MTRGISLCTVVMGFTGLVAEILLLRELLIVFGGNEFSIGIILAHWLVLEAIGSLIGGRWIEKVRNPAVVLVLTVILFSLTVPGAILVTRDLRSLLSISVGQSIGLGPLFWSSLLILAPPSLLHGALFTFCCRVYALVSEREAGAAGRVYVLETVGALIGGVASTYLLVPHFNAVSLAVGLAVVSFIGGLLVLVPSRNTSLSTKVVLGVLGVLILLSVYLLGGGWAEAVHASSIRNQWRNLHVVHYENSPYGNICVVENEGQYIFFQDGTPGLIVPFPDIASVEEFVHLALLAHPGPSRILILSGGAGGAISEVLKHPSIEAIEYAELDPLMLALLKRFPTPLTETELGDARVQIRHLDGRLALKASTDRYDVILVGIGEPASLQTNRFFTYEFFSLARDRLNSGGILVLTAPGSLRYLSVPLRNLNSCIFHTLKAVFRHVRVIPGDDRNVFLASDSVAISAIDTDGIVGRLNERRITANIFMPWHIEKKLHPGWQDWFARLIEGSSQRINRDFQPWGVFHSVSHWNAVWSPALGRLFAQLDRVSLWSVLLVIAVCLCVIRLVGRWRHATGISLAIATTGFAGMIFDLVVIFAFQVVYGYVFSWIGVLVASFMAGAACGAALSASAVERMRKGLRLFVGMELVVGGLSLLLPGILLVINGYMGTPRAATLSGWLFLVLCFACGLVTGVQFPLANALYLRESSSLGRTAGLLYASDLLGGWIGGIMGAIVLLPVLGVGGTCVTVALLKLASFVVVSTGRPSLPEGR